MERSKNKEIHKKIEEMLKRRENKEYIRKFKRRESKEIHETMDEELDGKKRNQRNT